MAPAEGAEAAPPRAHWSVVYYTACVRRGRWAVIVAWLAVAGVCAVWAPGLITDTNTDFDAVKGRPAYEAREAMQRHFPNLSTSTNIGVLFEADGGADLLSNAAVKKCVESVVNQTLDRTNPRVVSIRSYWQMVAAGAPPQSAAAALAAPKGCCPPGTGVPGCPNCSKTLLSVTFACGIGDKEGQKASDAIRDTVKAAHLTGVRATLIGYPAIIEATLHSVEMSMGSIDAFALPLAFAILAWILRSARLLVIPLVNIGISAATSFGIMDLIAQRMSVNSAVPSLTMSIMIAMNIDYSLFMLSRYKEELLRVRSGPPPSYGPQHGPPGDGDAAALSPWSRSVDPLPAERARVEVVEQVLNSAGHTITVSALTLIVCMLGLLDIPLSMLQSMGIGCAVTVAVILAISLSVTPALLFTFPGFFEKCVGPARCCRRGAAPGGGATGVVEPRESRGTGDTGGSTDPGCGGGLAAAVCPKSVTVPEADDDEEGGGGDAGSGSPDPRGVWYKLATLTLTFPYNVLLIVVIAGASVPFDMHLFGNMWTNAMGSFLPRGSDVRDAVATMESAFGIGVLYPFQVVIEPPPHVPALSEEYFGKAANLTYRLGDGSVPSVAVSDVLPLGPLLGPDFTVATLWPYFDPKNPESCINKPAGPLCPTLKLLNDTMVAPEGGALMLTVQPHEDTMGRRGREIYDAVLAVKDDWQSREPSRVYVAGTAAIASDGIALTQDSLPKLIAVVSAIIFVIIGVAFRSVLIPLRSIATIGLTLAVTFGVADFVYEHGALDWTGVASWERTGEGAIFWTVPAPCFAIIVGIGLDYDIFLLTRIVEQVSRGDSTKDAIRNGLCATGHIITAAGVIMGVAFSGLFFSNIAVMNQLAMYLVVSVLFDTFIVRSLLAPSIMGLFGDANWWPRFCLRRPAPTGYAPLSTGATDADADDAGSGSA